MLLFLTPILRRRNINCNEDCCLRDSQSSHEQTQAHWSKHTDRRKEGKSGDLLLSPVVKGGQKEGQNDEISTVN